MKPNPKMLFGNIFDDKNITPNYLARFTDDTIAKLIQFNTHSDLDTLLAPLQSAIIPFRGELGQVDTSFNSQMGKTATVDEFITAFTAYMKHNYVFIAAALGGDKSPEFKEFYPKGKTEYTNITKTKMETVMERLKTVADTYETELGTAISTKLQGFQSEWAVLRGSQLQQKSEVKINRSERTDARRNLEMALLKTIHQIAQKFPGDVEKCKVFFDFHLLFGVHHTTPVEEEIEA